ncbi:MAG: hypothetical protein VW378_05035 [bacterium]
MNFHYQDRGQAKTVILIPGWGTCPRLLAPLYPDYNLLFCLRPQPSTFVSSLLNFLGQTPVSMPLTLAGFSLGGFLAMDVVKRLSNCAQSHDWGHDSRHDSIHDWPHDKGHDSHDYPFDHVDLFSIRRCYPEKEITKVRASLTADPQAFMRTFFMQECDIASSPLFQNYLETLDLDHLLQGLDYLSHVSLSPACFLSPHGYLSVYHGRRDRIAPLRDIRRLFSAHSKAQLRLESGGHFFFLDPSFRIRHD